MRRTNRVAAGVVAGLLVFGGAACNDEDGDGATTDEEIEDVEEQVDEEVNQGEGEGED